MAYSSKIIENAVKHLSVFPGVGSKSALRMALFLSKKSEDEVQNLAQSLLDLKTQLKTCKVCGNWSDEEVCNICTGPNRDPQTICVVEDFKDVIAIENTAQFRGLYHVLGGLISPIDGIGPEDINMAGLLKRFLENDIKEVIVALSANLEGDTTTYYISKKLEELQIPITVISRGISIGSDLEYTDEITLGRSLLNRTPYRS